MVSSWVGLSCNPKSHFIMKISDICSATEFASFLSHRPQKVRTCKHVSKSIKWELEETCFNIPKIAIQRDHGCVNDASYVMLQLSAANSLRYHVVKLTLHEFSIERAKK